MMYKLFLRFLTQVTTPLSLKVNAANQTALAFTSTFKAVNQRALSTIGTTLVLSALLSACGGGGSSDTPAPSPTPTNPTTPTFSVSSSNFSIDENFTGSRTVASVSNATAITVSLSNTGVVTVTNSLTQVNVSSIANATGRTVLTITATNGSLSATTQVTVTVNAVNNPTTTPTTLTTPTFLVSSSDLSIDEDFTGSQLVASVSNATAITVSQSNTGVVTVTTANAQVNVLSILNANGRTTLTITATSGSLSATTEVNVIVNAVNDTPTLAVSSNSISTLGGFSQITINTTASDVEDTNISFTVIDASAGVVTVTTSTNAIMLNTIPGASGQTTLTVRVVDSSGTTVTQSITVNVTIKASAAPVVTVSTSLISVPEDFGTSVIIQTTATDADATNTITVSVSASRPIVTAIISTPTNGQSTITNSITLTAIGNANGTTTLTVLASDSGGQSQSTEIVVVVAIVNDTPTITVSTPALTVLEDFGDSSTVATFADVDMGDALTVTVTESNTGVVTVTTSASGVSIATIANVNGSTTLNILVSDGTLSSTAQVVVTVTPVNDPPALSVSTSALTLAEDFGAFLIATTRTDIDSTTLTLTVAESATGVVTVQTSTSGVSVSSIGQRSGRTTLTITLSDSQLSTTTQVVIDVTPVNDTPTLSVSTIALTLNEDFATTQLITVNRSDIENDTLTFSVTESMSDIVSVSTSSTGVQVVRIANANGQTTLTITVSDSNTSVSTQVLVTVNAVNDTPTLTVSSNSISTVGGFSPITINTIASDVEDANISFTVIDSDIGVVRITTSTNAIVLNTISGASGQTTLTVMVVDSSGTTVTEIITVNVSIMVSVAPVVTVSTNLISVQEDFGTSVIIQTTATDADGDIITVSVSASRPIVTAVISTPTNGQSTVTNSITLTAIGNANGTATLTVLASDSGGQSQSTEIVVVVAIVNDTPTITVSTSALTVLEDFNGANTVATFADVDRGDALTVTVTDSNTGVVTVTTSASGVSVATIANVNGSTTLNIHVSDGTLSSTAQVVVIVTPVNDPPALSVSTRALTLAEDFATVLIGTSRSDIDNNTLTLTVAESTTGVVSVTITDAGVQVANITDTNGVTTLTLSLSDSELTATAQVVVTVTPVNDPPTLSVSTTALTLNEDFSTTEVITVSKSDIDSNTLTFTVSESATGVVTVTTTDAGVQVTSINNANGVTTLTLSLSDGDLTATAQVVVTVTPVNDPPALNVSTTALILNEDFSTTEIITVSRSDIDSNTLTLTVSESATGVVTVTTTDAGVQVTSINNANGVTTLTISLSDGTTSTSTQISVTVTPVNDTPTLSVSINNLAINVDFSTITINVTLGDVEDSTLSFSVEDSNAGVVTFTTSANTILLNAITGVSGQTTLTVSLVDSSGTTVTQTIAVNVTGTPNTAPVLVVSTNRIIVPEDFTTGSVVIRTMATDAEGGTITVSVSSSSRLVDVAISAPINGSSTITLTAIENENGTATLTVSATDVGLLFDSTEIVVVVTPVEDTPTLTIPSAILTLVEDFDEIVTVATAMDADGDTLTISVAQTNPTIFTVSTSASGVSVTSLLDEEGSSIMTITVSDGKQNVTGQVVINLTPVNDTPTLTITSQSITVLEDFTDSIQIASGGDRDGDPLTFSVTESPAGIVRVSTVPVTAHISRSTVSNINGVTTLTISLSDGDLTTTAQVVVTVIPVNDTPTLSVSTNSISTISGFSTITINTTASDIEDSTLSFSVSAFPTNVVRLTTSSNSIILNAIDGVAGQTTLTVRTIDSSSSEVTQTIAVNVAPTPSNPPVLVISTNRIIVQEDFNGSVIIRTTATDADGDTITLSVSSTSRFVNVAISTPINGKSTITNSITLTAIADLNGTTTLTVQATDFGGISTTEEIIVVVNAVDVSIPFSLSTSTVSLSIPGSQVDRVIHDITISNPRNETLRTQIRVTTSGNNIFSANPAPVVSFTTNALTTTATLTSAASTAQLYFTIAPDQTGTATLTVHLTNLDDSSISQQTLVVSVISPNVPPTIVPASSSIISLVVHGGHLYANSFQNVRPLNPLLTEARALGAQLINFNSDEEYQFILGSVVVTHNTWWGLVLPQPAFPGELSWITHDSTIAYGFARANGEANLTVYPGHYPLPWNAGAGVTANRGGNATAINGTVYSDSAFLFLLQDVGDGGFRRGLYEFPQGIAPTSIDPISIRIGTSASVNLTGFDLNGDTIIASNWSLADPSGGSATFNHTTGNIGVQTVNMTYTPPATFSGQTTVVVTLQVNGLSTTYPISFIVDGPPTIALSTNAITLAEDFSNFVIGTTVTDGGVSGNLAFSVQTASAGIVNLSTTINSIQFSGALNFNGLVTLTVQATDSSLQSASTLVVVTVQAVNDTPTLTVSTDNITTNGGFTPITIDITATDVEDVTLPFSVQASTSGIVSFTTSVNNIRLSSIQGGSGQTTLTVTVTDSSGAVVIRTIAINVIVVQSTTPVLRVSTNLISLQEDFTAAVVIGTTATDAETGTLVVTVSSTTHLVNTVISTHSITLSFVANLFGTTTLTVLATDPGGLSDSTEIVVFVAPVNDTPTLSVSSNVVTLGTDPVVLNVSAFDIEDTTLAFSVSTGRGLINTVITTTSLTISQIGLNVSQMVLDLRTTDSDGVSVSISVTVVLPPLFIISTGIKTLDFAWSNVNTSSATYYRLRSNPDGGTGFLDLSTTGIVVSPNSTNIRQSTAQGLVSLHRYIPRVTNPQYGVNTCDATSCGTSFLHNTVPLTNVQLNSMIGRFRASNAGGGDEFGQSISVSGDGNTLVVGAYLEDSVSRGINPVGVDNNNLDNSGAVYVFRRNGGVWVQQAYIKASNPNRRAAFGYSVSLNSDGNTLAVGAYRENNQATGINSGQIGSAIESGAAYVFRFNANAWQQQAYIKASNNAAYSEFGTAVDLSADGNTLAVGARRENTSGNGSGAAYVFRFTTSNTWIQQAFLKASNPNSGDTFGEDLGISGDGNTLAVGTPGEDSNAMGINGAQNNNSATASGAVYLFRFSTSTNVWAQQSYIKASNAAASSGFGEAVRLNGDGNTFVVGASARSNQEGAVYVFRYNTSSNTWSEQAFLRASNAEAGDQFGGSVSLSLDGNTFVVGAEHEDGSTVGIRSGNNNGTSNSGAAYVFEFSNGSWVQQAYIKAADPAVNAIFGESVSISNDGATVAVGANGVSSNTGAAYLY